MRQRGAELNLAPNPVAWGSPLRLRCGAQAAYVRTYQEKVRQREAELAARAAAASPGAAPDAKRPRMDGAFSGDANGAPHAQAPAAAAAAKAEPPAEVYPAHAQCLCLCINMYCVRCTSYLRAMGSWCGVSAGLPGAHQIEGLPCQRWGVRFGAAAMWGRHALFRLSMQTPM